MAMQRQRSFLRLSWLMVVVLLLAACGGQQPTGTADTTGASPGTQPAGSAQGGTVASPSTGAAAQSSPEASTASGTQASADASPSAQGATSGAAVTLRYALWNQNQVPTIEQMVAEFKKSHPNINVEIELTPFDQYWTKLEAGATGGSAPDLFWMNGPNFVKYASNDILMPLDEQVTADDEVDAANYPEALVNLYSYDGKLYGLPRDFDTIGLWYNKELFDAAGVAYPDDTWTWDNVGEAAQKLTKADQGVWGIAAQMINQEGFYNTIYQNGGYVISPDKTASGYDNPATLEGLKFWTDMIEQGVSPTHAQMTETKPLDMFQSGKVAMIYGGSWRAVQFAKNEYAKDRVNVAPLPKGKEDAVIIHGLANVINANTAHPEEAWEFLKFLGGKEAAEINAATGAVIPAYNGSQDAWVKANPQYNLQVFLDQLEHAVPYPVSADTAKWQSVEKELLGQAWAGQMPVEEAATQVAQRMNDVLKQEK